MITLYQGLMLVIAFGSLAVGIITVIILLKK